jgi:hypothetical protein
MTKIELAAKLTIVGVNLVRIVLNKIESFACRVGNMQHPSEVWSQHEPWSPKVVRLHDNDSN